jgi:hypothetical protein
MVYNTRHYWGFRFCPHLRTETDPVSETLCSLEYWTMDKVKKPNNPESLTVRHRQVVMYIVTSSLECYRLRICSSHSSDYKDIANCNAIKFGEIRTSRRNISTPSLESKSKPNKKPAEAGGRVSLPLASSGGDKFLRNFGLFPNYTSLKPRRQNYSY